MKILLENGVELISGSKPFSKSGFRDPWPSHSNGTPVDDIYESASGQFIVAWFFRLKDGSEFYYTRGGFVNADTAWLEILEEISMPFGNPPLPAIGEAFNYVMRLLTTGKYTESQFADLLSSN